MLYSPCPAACACPSYLVVPIAGPLETTAAAVVPCPAEAAAPMLHQHTLLQVDGWAYVGLKLYFVAQLVLCAPPMLLGLVRGVTGNVASV